MNTLLTDRKYTVILSAYQSYNTELMNLTDTERMYDRLEHHYHVHAVRAVTVNHNSVAQSFVIHTNSRNAMTEVKRLALEAYHQGSVLVRNNRKHDVQSHDSDANTKHVGQSFSHHDKAPKGINTFIILNGKDYWSIN